jgi:hypothetical protein
METICLNAIIGTDGKVRLEVPSQLPPGPVKVKVELEPASPESAERKLLCRDFYGAAKELNAKEDAQDFVNRLRDEWER